MNLFIILRRHETMAILRSNGANQDPSRLQMDRSWEATQAPWQIKPLRMEVASGTTVVLSSSRHQGQGIGTVGATPSKRGLMQRWALTHTHGRHLGAQYVEATWTSAWSRGVRGRLDEEVARRMMGQSQGCSESSGPARHWSSMGTSDLGQRRRRWGTERRRREAWLMAAWRRRSAHGGWWLTTKETTVALSGFATTAVELQLGFKRGAVSCGRRCGCFGQVGHSTTAGWEDSADRWAPTRGEHRWQVGSVQHIFQFKNKPKNPYPCKKNR
jgi:hypothetical protein